MSVIHINQIRAYLDREYHDLIDTSDIANNDQEQIDNNFISRSLAAFAIQCYVNIDKSVVAQYVVDGFNDNGIDAFYYDEDQAVLYLAQSKWHKNGNGTISKGEMSNFISGIKDLFNSNFERFNDKVNIHKDYLEKAINSSNTKLCLILAHTGIQEIGEHPKREMDDFLDEMNNPTEVCTFCILDQGKIHNNIRNGSQGSPIDINIVLRNYGYYDDPYKACYGFADAAQIADWWSEFNPRIFAPNIRMFLGDSEVNKELENTIISSPEKFYYFNNGITILCNSFAKTRAGGSRRDNGTFECKGVAIVNGAQTVGTIGRAYSQYPDRVEQVSVHVKLISLEACPEGFDVEITRATNTQNKIESRDFISQDPLQKKLNSELWIDRIHYSYKKGDNINDRSSGFTFEEAAVALACSSSDINLSTMAKGQVGRLWADIKKHPYTTIFKNDLTGVYLWNIVQIHRIIDDEINKKMLGLPEGRQRTHYIHGNRFVAHHLFKMIQKSQSLSSITDPKSLTPLIGSSIDLIIGQMMPLIRTKYDEPTLAYFFKNQEKCRQISSLLNI